MANNIILIGFMGVGKGRTARALAEKTGLFALDTDDLIESMTKMKIRRLDRLEIRFEFIERYGCRICIDLAAKFDRDDVVMPMVTITSDEPRRYVTGIECNRRDDDVFHAHPRLERMLFGSSDDSTGLSF